MEFIGNKTFSRDNRINGEMTVRKLSELAKQGYRDTDPLDVYMVYEYKETDKPLEFETIETYYIRDCDGVTKFDSLAELENYLETLAVDDDDMDADEISALLACETWMDAFENDIP